MNFVIINNVIFTVVGGGMYKREYALNVNKDGTANIIHYITRKTIFFRLNMADVRVNNEPITNWEQVRVVVYNYFCDCNDDAPSPSLEGYFDEYWDEFFD